MMDASSLYPDGFHPVVLDWTTDALGMAKAFSRYTAPTPVKYYFVDFGISSHFSPEDTERLVLGADGLDKTVPELSPAVPYDPFKVDIFVLGNFLRKRVYKVG